MKILVVSDSHGAVDVLEKVIESHIHGVRHVFHLGDGCGDIGILAHRYPDVSFHVVSGNCDEFSSNETSYPDKLIVSVGGKKILATHGHKYHVKMSYDRICYAALEAGVDICLFGHTHNQTSFEYERIYFLNPGAIYKSNEELECAIIDLSNELISVKLIAVNK